MSLEFAGFMFPTFASFSEFGRDARRPKFFKIIQKMVRQRNIMNELIFHQILIASKIKNVGKTTKSIDFQILEVKSFYKIVVA